MLCHCDINSHSLAVMLRQFGLTNLKQVFHIGSHDGIEADIYHTYGSPQVVWFEANPKVIPYLLKRIENYHNDIVVEAALWDKTGEILQLHHYRDDTDGAASLLLPDKFNEYVPECNLLSETTEVRTITLDELLDSYNIDYQQCNFLNIDVQGAELNVFRGAHNFLSNPNLQSIWCEAQVGPVYKGGPCLGDIINFLAQYEFYCIHFRKDWELEGDCLFIRR